MLLCTAYYIATMDMHTLLATAGIALMSADALGY
jgi:hypothetical protein